MKRVRKTGSGCLNQEARLQTKAFTFIELLVVVASIAILAATLLPALASVNQKKALGIACLNNLKQLTLAAHSYAGDFQGAIPVNDTAQNAWVTGDVSGRTSLNGITNIANLQASVLWPYNQSLGIYRCPGDQDVVAGVSAPRVRDYSLNCMMGNNSGPDGDPGSSCHPSTPEHQTFASVLNPSPSAASFFFDEQSSTTLATTSIDDGYFAIDDGSAGSYFMYGSRQWRNVPSSRHGNFGQLSYADGHAGKMTWLEPDTHSLQGINAASAEFNNTDKQLLWLSTYASGSVPGVPW